MQLRCKGMVETVIGASGVVKTYPGHVVLQDVSFRVGRGEIFALLGPNGAGKTTLVQLLQFIKEPTRGFVFVLDSEEEYGRTKSYRAIKEKIGVLPQGFSGFGLLTVYENLDYFARMYPRHVDLDQLLKQLGLEEKRNVLFKHLSGGQKQRVGIGAALVNDPEVLFLDEPTTGLDPRARRDVWEAIKELKARGRTVFLTTHYMDEAYQLADQVCILVGGRIIAEGSPADLINQYGGGNTLVIRECCQAAADRLLAALPGSHVDGSDVLVQLPDGDGIATLAKATQLLGEDSSGCKEIYVRKSTLEDVFLRLTGERLVQSSNSSR